MEWLLPEILAVCKLLEEEEVKRSTGQSPESILVATKLWFHNIVAD